MYEYLLSFERIFHAIVDNEALASGTISGELVSMHCLIILQLIPFLAILKNVLGASVSVRKESAK
jgi:hypothetical protein